MAALQEEALTHGEQLASVRESLESRCVSLKDAGESRVAEANAGRDQALAEVWGPHNMDYTRTRWP